MLCSDDMAISLSDVSPNYNDGQNSSTEDSTSSLPHQSNTTHVMPAAVETDVLLQETGDEHLNDDKCSNMHDSFNTEGDPSLVLECIEEEFTAHVTVFDNDNRKSVEQNLSRKKAERPADSKQTVSSGHYCTFCGKLQSEIRSHLVTAHRHQPQISEIAKLPLELKDRYQHLECLIAEGDRKHGEKMLETDRRTAILSQRPTSRSLVPGSLGRKLQKKNSSQSLSYEAACSQKRNRTRDRNGNCHKSTYSKQQKSAFCHTQHLSRHLRCEHCGSFVLRSAVWLHHRRCVRARHKTNVGERSSDVSSSYQNAASHSQFISYDNILKNKGMDSNVDDVLSLVLDEDNDSLQSVLTKDMLIWQYASLRMQSLANQDSKSSDSIYSLCQELQALARLVVECHSRKPSTDLHTLIHPDHFNFVISVLRKQSATMVNIIGHVVNIKIVDALQHNDNVVARHAWNFRELFLLWQDSLREDDGILQTDADVQEERHTSVATECQLQQPNSVRYNSDSQAELCYSHDNVGLAEANALSDKIKNNPLQHVFPSSSFATLAVDGNVIVDQVSSLLPDSPMHEAAYVDETEASDADDHDRLLNNSTSDHEHACTSVRVQHMNPVSGCSVSSSFKEITIRGLGVNTVCCYFCGKFQSNLAHHFKVTHANEKEIIELASLKTELAQTHSFKKLRNLGNHRHNQKVLRDGRGTLVVFRPKRGAKAEDYSPCKGCWHYVLKTELLRHASTCPLSVQKSGTRNKRAIGNNSAPISEVSSDGIHSQKLPKSCKTDNPGHIRIQSLSNHAKAASYRSLCYFCGCWKTKIFRHLRSRHSNEPEMMEIMSMGLSDSVEEMQHIQRIRNLGIHQHNVKVLKEGRGKFFISRMSERSREPHNFLPCEFCWRYICKTSYHTHHCRFSAQSELSHHRRDRQLFADAHFYLPTSKKFHDQVNEILDGMMNGDVKNVAQSDLLIREYVAKLLSIKVARKAITNKVQLLAQFLIETRKVTSLFNATLSDCISLKKFHECFLAVKTLGHFDSETSSYRSPTSVLKIKNILRQVTKLMKKDAMDKRDRDAVKNLDKFIQLCMSELNLSAELPLILDVEPESAR